MTSISGECCGKGRDQLVYSLEFTRFHDLTDSVLTTLMRDTATAIAFPRYGEYLFVERLDRATWRRTLRRRDAFKPVAMAGPFVPPDVEPPRSMIYIAMPNVRDRVTLPLLANGYVVGPEQRFESDGYAVSVYRLERRNSDGAASSVTMSGAATGRPPR